MQYDAGMEQNENAPEFVEQMGLALTAIAANTVNLDWIKHCDLDTIDALEAIAAHEAKQLLLDNEEVSFTEENDLYVYALGIARSVSEIFNAMRHNKPEQELFVLLFHTAKLAYEVGLRDASEGRLSEGCVRQVAKVRDEADSKHDAMREFHEDIRAL